MKYEKSCGAVVYKKVNDYYEFLVIKHNNGHHWGFPKGHVEEGEKEAETALREIEEETGLLVELSENFRYTMEYSPSPNTIKEVVYFIAEAKDDSVSCQLCEIEDSKWLKFREAIDVVTHDVSKEMLKQAYEYLNIDTK